MTESEPLSMLDELTKYALMSEIQGSVQIIHVSDLAPIAPSDPADLRARWSGSSARLINAQQPVIVTGITTGFLLNKAVLALRTRYPQNHCLRVIRLDGAPIASSLQIILDQDIRTTHPYALHIAPLEPLDDQRSIATVGFIAAQLRSKGGCPWDREQTPESLTPFMLEEAHEVVDAIERGHDVDVIEELGDVLLQTFLHAQIAEESDRYSIADVAAALNAKLIRRHPHVFGNVEVRGASDVLRNWEAIKRVEKASERTSVLDGIPVSLPSLLLAQTVGRKAAKIGFDWDDAAGALLKIDEELAEVHEATTLETKREEIGDLLFAITSWCRHSSIDADAALRHAVQKFEQRFRRIEHYVALEHTDIQGMAPIELDELWTRAKNAPDNNN